MSHESPERLLPGPPPGTGSGRWIGANALGQAAGLTVTALLGHLSGRFGELPAGVALAGVLLAGLIEGALVGSAQAWGARLRGDAARRWIGLTTAAFGLWWALGAVASLFEPPDPSRLTVVLVAVVAGGALGLLVGALQGHRRPPSLRAAWLGANTAAWSAGLLLAALAAELVPYGPNTWATFAITALGGAATGAIVGTVTTPWRP